MVTFTLYNEFKEAQANGEIDFSNDTIKCALFESTYTPDIDADSFFDDISANESSGTGYTSGGIALTNVTVTKDNTNDRAVIDADDVAFTGLSVDYQYVVFYKDTGTASTSTLIGYADNGSSVTLSSDDLTIQLNATGLITVD